MKRWLFVEFLFVLCLLVACGDDSSSGVPDEPEVSSSSSSEEKSSSSEQETGCDTKPYYREGWPTLMDHVSSLKHFYAYGSDVGCEYDLEKTEATLYKFVKVSADSSALEKIGTVPVKTTLLDDEGSDSWNRSWKYEADLSSLDNPALPDGEYRIAWGEGFNVSFYIGRDFREIKWMWGLEKKMVALSVDTNLSINDYYSRVTIYDVTNSNKIPLKCIRYMGAIECNAKDIIDTLKDGPYIISMEAVRKSSPNPEFAYALSEARSGEDSLLWALALDSAGNFREGVSGMRLDTNQWIDRVAPSFKLVKDAEYSVKANGRYTERIYSVILDVFENMLKREKQTLTLSVYVNGGLAYRDYVEQKTDSLQIPVKVSYLDSTIRKLSLKIDLKDESGNMDSLMIGNFVVADSQSVDTSLVKALPTIPAIKYDCSKYKCVPTSYLNPDVEYGELLDERDSLVYRTVKIGKQEWMAQNLNHAVDSSFCDGNKPENCEKFGRLYTWNSAMGKSMEECSYEDDCDFSKDSIKAIGRIRGVCPEGWHVPSFDDFYTLKTTVEEQYPEKFGLMGARLVKSMYGWPDGVASNETGFSVLPSSGSSGSFWIAEVHLEYEDNHNFSYSNYSHDENIYLEFGAREDAFPKFLKGKKKYHRSLRCLKN